jgi:DNA-binding MarR family transcriptional regulator
MASVSAICDGLLAIVRNDKIRDLTMRQLAVLATSAIYTDTESRTVRSISKRLNVNKPAVTRAADALEGQGYLKRRQHADDKRVVVLEVTPTGSKFLRALVSV